MAVKYTNHFLKKLELLLEATSYTIRYEKGNFQSGYCILKDRKVIIINKFLPLTGKINSLIDIIRTINIDKQRLNNKNRALLNNLYQITTQF
ncbi:MAG TPA: hypothetical protein ACFCUD_05610 [Cyclobacteriaceae bacterium]